MVVKAAFSVVIGILLASEVSIFVSSFSHFGLKISDVTLTSAASIVGASNLPANV